MRIDFDAGNAAELAAVAALIGVLRGDVGVIAPMALGEIHRELGAGQDDGISGFDDEVDPAEAFDAPAAEQAFAAPPVANVAAAPPPGVEVDKNGLPWDARIHSGPAKDKPKNADGTWRKKRGVDDATIAAISAELRAVMSAPTPGNAAAGVPTPAQPAPPPTPVAADMASGPGDAIPASEPPATVPPPPVAAAAVPLAEAPAPAAATPPPASPAPSTGALSFADLMRRITGLQSAGVLSVEGTAEISASLGIGGVRDLMHRPDLIPSFDALLPAMPSA